MQRAAEGAGSGLRMQMSVTLRSLHPLRPKKRLSRSSGTDLPMMTSNFVCLSFRLWTYAQSGPMIEQHAVMAEDIDRSQL